MKRKQHIQIRSIQTDFEPRTFESLKQNDKETYYMDPKIVELKKKYQMDKTLQRSYTKPNLKHHSTAPSQQQVLRKLENIKSELQAIPGWQRHVKSILFQQLSFSKQNDQVTQTSKNQLNCFSRIAPQNSKQESSSQNKFLTSSNLSFKINQTNSIQRSDFSLKPPIDFNHQTPVKKVKQFDLDKNKFNIKERKFQMNQDQKNFDQKINEISRKIKQAQIKKKNLGVEFVPFEKKSNYFHNDNDKTGYQCRSRTPQLGRCDRLKQVISVQKQSKPPRPSKSISKIGLIHQKSYKNVFDQVSPRFAPLLDYSKQIKKQQKIKPTPSNYQYTPNKFPWQKQIPLNKDKKSNRTYSNHCTSQNTAQNTVQLYDQKDLTKINQENVKNKPAFFDKIEQGTIERKKKYPQVQQKRKKKEITTKLVQAFCEQVKLDDKFRNNKLWLKASKNQKKYERLKSLLQMQGFSLPMDKIIQEFEVLQKEDNPFFSVTSQNCDLQQVARSYIQCEKYWRKYLYKRFNRDALEDQDFSSLTIDLQKKGFISLEDLVRFLNMETGTFFRNRDLFTIFRRLSNHGQKLTFNIFLNTFCS